MLKFFCTFAASNQGKTKMIIAKSLQEFAEAYQMLDNKDNIGFIPTMGALHQGHISLVEFSQKNYSHTIVSVFVNPTQFNNPNDLKSYPRTLDEDCNLLKANGVDIVFAPRVEDIYPHEDTRVFNMGNLDKYGEGPKRPGHFNGVVQVVTRLFDIVKPKYALFGEKDFQQVAIIKHFVKELNYNIEIIACPIIREKDGLALSSRNTLLNSQQREAAPHIYNSICKAKELMKNTSPQNTIKKISEIINTNNQLLTEYVEIIDAKNLSPINNWSDAEHIQLWCAVYAGKVRLIDNIKLK